ncbi:hypothetical protein C9374_001350 [Naegleria lovaniensis]|uniref:Uncharacterized protein n=1 Tax=Naegleria lovaniensis TaxID=51637 RepID=A0AA88GXI9_NAELO|nr:uncharacterized protein C9374_001350 [Naegleria lovaniensis]KAG2387756.1 hypothetical protein C9374_001350 [Naegleria lovaniensis]
MFFDEDEIENAFFHDTTTEQHQSEDMLYSEEEEFAMKIVEEIYRERSLHDQQLMLLQRKRKLSNSNHPGSSYKCNATSSLSSSSLVLCDDEKVLLSHLPSRRTHDKVDWKEYCDMTMRQQFWLMSLDEMILWIIFKIKHCIMMLLHRE